MQPDHAPEDFEEVYRRYEFAPLVQIALNLAARIKRISAPKVQSFSDQDGQVPIGPRRVQSP